jgi:hypothetical protein
VNFAIIGRVKCILFTMFKGMKRPRFIFGRFSLIGLERLILLLSHIVGCPTRQSSFAPLGTKRNHLTKSLQFKLCILPKKISTFIEFILISTTQVLSNVGLKTMKGQTIFTPNAQLNIAKVEPHKLSPSLLHVRKFEMTFEVWHIDI